ncbi:MAG: hypothetical protein ACJAVK_003134 [Akkermansiaceae bacterium]|jgi:hypothetical protein
MKLPVLLLLASCPVFLPGQSVNQATLTLVEEAGFNEVEIELDISNFGDSDDTSVLSGTLEVQVNISPIVATTDQLTILSADVSGSDIELKSRTFISSYEFTGTNLGFTATTIIPPGIVDPATGGFEANQHAVSTTRGLLRGEADTLITEPIDVDFDFSNEPFSGPGVGMGTITVTTGRIEGRRRYFDLTVELPISLDQTIDQEGLPVSADVTIAGTIKATGETFVDLPDYQTWASDLGLAADSENEADLQPDTPNYLLFALGFDQATAPREIFDFGPEGATLKVGGSLGLGGLEIEWSDDLVNWVRVPQSSMANGRSQINLGDSLSVSPTVKMETTKKYLRVIKSVAP